MSDLQLSAIKDLFMSELRSGIIGDLKGNLVARRLYDIVRSGNHRVWGRDRIVAWIGSAKIREDIGEDDPVKVVPSFRDARILNIALKNIKKYPEAQDKRYFGLSLYKDERPTLPVSSVFLGSNGIGKTSIYAALEYAGIGDINSAKVRGYTLNIGQVPDALGGVEMDSSDFLRHHTLEGKGKIYDASIVVDTLCGNISIEGLGRVGNPPIRRVSDAFYCSEYDVRYLEKCSDYSEYIIEQLGMKDFWECLQLLYYMTYNFEVDHRSYIRWNSIYKGEKNDEPLLRLKLGVLSGVTKINFESLKKSDLYHLASLIDNLAGFSQNDKKLFLEIIKIINKGLKSFITKDWYSAEIRKKFEDSGNIVRSILRKLKRNSIPKDFGSENKELNDFASFVSRLLNELEEIENIIDEQEEDGPCYNNLLEKQIKIYCDNFVNIESFENYHSDYLSIIYSNGSYENTIAYFYELINFIENRLKKIIESWLEIFKESLKNQLSGYFEIDNDALDIEYKFSPLTADDINSKLALAGYEWEGHSFLSFKVHVMSSGGDYSLNPDRTPVSPRSYFNTFKYRLFCVSIKMLLSCAAKGIYNINYPFIIDDVFDSSDFESRMNLKEYIKKLMEEHDFIINDPRYKLQIIFFTQDDLIAGQVSHGITLHSGSENSYLGRLYDYHEMQTDKKNIRVLTSDKDNNTENNIEYILLADEIR